MVAAGGRVYAIGLFRPGTAQANARVFPLAPTLAEVEKGTFPAAQLPGMPATVDRARYPMAYRGDLCASCLDPADGRPVWIRRLTDSGLAFKTNQHNSTAWELASPLIDKEQLYLHDHTGRLYCLNAGDGTVAWEVNLFDHGMSTWYGGQQGNSCGPLKVGDVVIVSYQGGGSADAPAGSPSETGYLTVGGFDAANGSGRWVTRAPVAGLNVRTARLGLATIEGRPTVLCSCGGGTMGLDPSSGRILWLYDHVQANSDTLKQVPPKFAMPENVARDYRKDAIRPGYPGYAPLAWRNYVVDAATVGHNSVNSAVWCLKIENGRAARVWQTSAFVPQSGSLKSHLVVHDGKLYGFDSYFPRFATQYAVTRPYRGEAVGEFQCRDIATGRLLWSSDALHPEPPGRNRVDAQLSKVIIINNSIIVTNNNGFTISRILETGVEVIARVPRAKGRGTMVAEPVWAGGRLLIRQLDTDPQTGLGQGLGAVGIGNLFCIGLGHGEEPPG